MCAGCEKYRVRFSIGVNEKLLSSLIKVAAQDASSNKLGDVYYMMAYLSLRL